MDPPDGSPPMMVDVLALVKAKPGLAAVADEYGRLPLTLALTSGFSVDVITALIEAYPAGLLHSPGQNVLRECVGLAEDPVESPLESILRSRSLPLDVLQLCLTLQPFLVRDRLEEFGHCTLLRYMLHLGCPAAAVELVLKANPAAAYDLEELAETDELVSLLALAVRTCEQDVVQLVLNAKPGALKELRKSRTVLHDAIYFRDDEAVIELVRFLVEQDKALVTMADHDRVLPLHLALAKCNYSQVASLLLQAAPATARKAAMGCVLEDGDMLPLHLRLLVLGTTVVPVREDDEVALLQQLVEAAPEVLQQCFMFDGVPRDPLAFTATHCVSRRITSEVFALSIEEKEEREKLLSLYRNSPLHMASALVCSLECLAATLHHFGSDVTCIHEESRLTPAGIAIAAGASYEFVSMLLANESWFRFGDRNFGNFSPSDFLIPAALTEKASPIFDSQRAGIPVPLVVV
eukprot:PLAT9115.1.p2 GENE.PLAT9115.1~~PLAT9115.1.p2  ORF type:complete len:487 (+),score=189.50 PLAT9115.1:71-1462(+)